MLGLGEFSAVLDLPDETKNAIQNFERLTWAANVTTPELEPSWRKFISLLQKVGVGSSVKSEEVISLLQYLPTIDSAKLIASIGQKSVAEQVKFISMLNWLVSQDADLPPQDVYAAKGVLTRLLMSARMALYPKVYAPARLQRVAMALLSAQQSSTNTVDR